MSTDTLKRAVELLRLWDPYSTVKEETWALAADLAAITEQEPVAWMTPGGDVSRSYAWVQERCRPDGPDPVALYCSPQREQVPEGWQLVPIEPTVEMIEAGFKLGNTCHDQWFCPTNVRVSYRAMLAAAPKEPSK